MWLSSAAGKRFAVLFAAVACPCLLLGTAVAAYRASWPQPVGALGSTPIALIGGMIAVAVVRSGRFSAADDSPHVPVMLLVRVSAGADQ
jgi:hypothetical protein